MRILSIFILLLFFSNVQAQENEVLVRIDGIPYYTGEFNHLFGKNADLIDSDEKQDIRRNIDLFIDYKLKVIEAENQKMDTLSSFTKSYENYKNQLANDYMLNTEVNQHLVEEAYDRLTRERDVSYILIRLDENASAWDTVTAYERAMEFRQKVVAGGDFEKLAQQYSEDPSAKQNNGHLGWVKVFKTVYPFENMVYQTPVGEVSQPFRSQFGYHVLKVNEERKAAGKVQIAQILVKHDEQDSLNAQKKIQNIYQKLQNGSDFNDMVRQYSEDENTREKGGLLNPFEKGGLKSKRFENIAFALDEAHPLSEPFKTEWGWHIIKLVKSYPIRSFDQEKKELKFKIKQNSRSTVVRDSLTKELKKKYHIETTAPGLAFFEERLGKNFIRKAKVDLPDKAFIKIKESSRSYEKFLDQLQKHQGVRKTDIDKATLHQLFSDFQSNFVYQYEKEHLAENNSDYATELKDHREGLLIYELIRKDVWDKSDDSLALRKFYEHNQVLFTEPERFQMQIVSANDQKTAKKVFQALKSGKDLKEIEALDPSIIVNSGTFVESHPQLPDNFSRTPGVSKPIVQNGVYVVAQTQEVIPEGIPSFEKAQGKAVQKYQEFIEYEMMQELRKKYRVEVYNGALKYLKQ